MLKYGYRKIVYFSIKLDVTYGRGYVYSLRYHIVWVTKKRHNGVRKEAHGMKVFSTYGVKIKHYNHIFKDTISIYRGAVEFLIKVCLNEWDGLSRINGNLLQQQYVERLCHKTANHPIH